MKDKTKKLVSILMLVLILLSSIPINAFAAFITDINSDAQFGVISGSLTEYGHELHYSYIENDDKNLLIDNMEIRNAKGQPAGTKLFRYKNMIAGYTHIYWADMDDLLDLFK